MIQTKVIQQTFQKDARRLDPATTIADVAHAFGVRPRDIKSRCRKEQFVRPRFIYARLLRDSGYSYSEIGNLLKRDHTAAIHAANRARDMIEVEREVRPGLNHLRSMGYRI